jgi:hypothetical protein
MRTSNFAKPHPTLLRHTLNSANAILLFATSQPEADRHPFSPDQTFTPFSANFFAAQTSEHNSEVSQYISHRKLNRSDTEGEGAPTIHV